MGISNQSVFVQFALTYSLIGLIVAIVTTLARWYFPIVASSASGSEYIAAARRVHRYQSIARGFSYLEYVLLVVGSLAELLILATNAADQYSHAINLAIYALLWLMVILNSQKRSIIGRVVTPRQQPVKGVVVRAEHNNAHFHEAAVTDANGKFHLRVYPGDYQLSAEKTDHEPAQTAIKTNSKTANRVSMVVKPKSDQERMTSPVRTVTVNRLKN